MAENKRGVATISTYDKIRMLEIIDVLPSKIPNWEKGARSMLFMYTRDSGNFILRGFRGECEEYAKANYSHYFYRLTMFNNGSKRGYWRFWKDNVNIPDPVFLWIKKGKKHRYKIRFNVYDDKTKTYSYPFEFNRMPNKWIKPFNKL